MKSLIKTVFSGSVIALLATKWELATNLISIQNVFQEDTSLLIKLGGMIGYTIFIAFGFFIQQGQIKEAIQHQRNKGSILYVAFTVISIVFLSYITMSFTIQIALINLMIYLIIISMMDFIGEKLMMSSVKQKSHPKTII